MSSYNLPIVWPKDFIKKIREWSPGDLGLIHTLENGQDYVLRILERTSTYKPLPIDVLNAFKNENLQQAMKEEIERSLTAPELLEEGYKIAAPFRKYPLNK